MPREDEMAGKDVQAEVGYMAEMWEPLVVENYGPDFQFFRHNGSEHRERVNIRDGRTQTARWGLDKSGFQLTSHRSAVRDFFDADEVKAVYYRELENLIARTCGASQVIVYHHAVRSGDETERSAKQILGPAKLAHSDYT